MTQEEKDLLADLYVGAALCLVQGTGELRERLSQAYTHLRQGNWLLETVAVTDRERLALGNLASILKEEDRLGSMTEDEMIHLAGDLWVIERDHLTWA